MRWLPLLFLAVTLTELWLLVQIGTRVGAPATLGLAVATALLGGWLAKREGLRVIGEWRRAAERLEPPTVGLLDGAVILAGAALLMTPGVLTDAVGLALLLPASRRPLVRWLRRRLERRFSVVTIHGVSAGGIVETDGEEVANR